MCSAHTIVRCNCESRNGPSQPVHCLLYFIYWTEAHTRKNAQIKLTNNNLFESLKLKSLLILILISGARIHMMWFVTDCRVKYSSHSASGPRFCLCIDGHGGTTKNQYWKTPYKLYKVVVKRRTHCSALGGYTTDWKLCENDSLYKMKFSLNRRIEGDEEDGRKKKYMFVYV